MQKAANPRNLSAIALIATAGASLAACASTSDMGVAKPSGLSPRYAPRAEATPAMREEPRRGDSPRAGPVEGSRERPTIDPKLRGTQKPYEVAGVWYTPKDDPDYDVTGIASWYGDAHQYRKTANGETFDMYLPSAAHKTLPLPSIVEVTNLDNGRKLKARVNDRGPFVDGRIIDLSRNAADQLGMLQSGTAHVRVRYIGPAPRTPEPSMMIASAEPRTYAKPSTPVPVAPAAAPPAPVREIRFGLTGPADTPPTSMREPSRERTADPVRPIERSSAPSVALAAYEVQAGAFSSMANAERCRRALSGTGKVEIRTVERDAGVLYRVVVSRLDDEDMAAAVRDRVAGMGYPEARVIRPSL